MEFAIGEKEPLNEISNSLKQIVDIIKSKPKKYKPKRVFFNGSNV